MTDAEKAARFTLLTGESDTDMVNAYLEQSEQMILERRYPLTGDRSELGVPARYEGLQVELAAALWARRGAEGESEHAENGVSRVYEGFGTYLGRVIPCIGYGDGAR